MNVNTNQDNFDMNIFKDDLIELEKSEAQIWDFHKREDVINLFKSVKQRSKIGIELYTIYRKNHEHFDAIAEEIVAKYPQIKSVNFHNNHDKIIEYFEKLIVLLNSQFEKLNVTDNLIEYNAREEVLNANKIRAEESEFTTLIKELIRFVKREESIKEEVNEIENLNNSVEDEEKSQNQVFSESVVEEKIEIRNEPEVEEKEEEPLTKVEEESAETTQSMKEIGNTDEPKIEEEIKAENQSENEQEHITEIIKKYFTYKDSAELNEEEKEIIERNTLKSDSAKKYAKILLELEREKKLSDVEKVSREIFVKTLTELGEYEIDSLPFTYSTSWAMWDVAKQLYYLEHPEESSKEYNLENPLESEDKQQEIINRHIGWEVFTQMGTQNLDKFLNKIRDPVYGKRVINVMIEKTNNENMRLPSCKLSELGKNIRMALKEN